MFTVEKVSKKGLHFLLGMFGELYDARLFANMKIRELPTVDIDIHEYRIPLKSLVRSQTDFKTDFHEMWDHNLQEWLVQH